MVLALGLHNGNFSHAQGLDELRPSACRNGAQLVGGHENAPARLAHRRHRAQHRSVVAVFQVGPYPSLRDGHGMERDGIRGLRGAARDVEQEAVAQKDAQDTQVLRRVVY